MIMEVTHQRKYSRIPALAKWVTLLILICGLAAGVATISERLVELSQLAKVYYHPHLAAVGLSDDFFIWYCLASTGNLDNAVCRDRINLVWGNRPSCPAFDDRAVWGVEFAAPSRAC